MKDEDFKYELLKSFHQQFAQNQNHNQNLFIQVLSILLTVMIGFGYTLFNFKASNPVSNGIGLFEFTIALAISEFILLIGIALVSSMAVTYRREQLLNTKINESAKVTVDSSNDGSQNIYKIFPVSYNPIKNYYKKVSDNKKMFFDWMPDFHIIFSRMFLIIQLFLIFIYCVKLLSNSSPVFSANNHFIHHSLFFIFSVLCFPISLRIIKVYHNKLSKFYLENGMQELKDNRYKNG